MDRGRVAIAGYGARRSARALLNPRGRTTSAIGRTQVNDSGFLREREFQNLVQQALPSLLPIEQVDLTTRLTGLRPDFIV